VPVTRDAPCRLLEILSTTWSPEIILNSVISARETVRYTAQLSETSHLNFPTTAQDCSVVWASKIPTTAGF
jgi:hypothetical protein